VDDKPRYVPSGFVMSRLVNPIVSRLGGTLVLVVEGRTSGRTRAVPLGRPFDVDGVRYLVAGGGETHWVRNLRARGRGLIRVQGVSAPFVAVEMVGAERERIVAEYRRRQGRTVEGFFRALPDPADHPVFRVDPVDPGAPGT
jgi:deazaflavin-dependent oxidoreductase (nitroreductase family)